MRHAKHSSTESCFLPNRGVTKFDADSRPEKSTTYTSTNFVMSESENSEGKIVYPELSADHTVLIAEFRRLVGVWHSENSIPPPIWASSEPEYQYQLWNFAKSRQFELKAAMDMYCNAVKWRIENKVSSCCFECQLIRCHLTRWIPSSMSPSI